MKLEGRITMTRDELETRIDELKTSRELVQDYKLRTEILREVVYLQRQYFDQFGVNYNA